MWREYFSFNKRQRNGIIVLATLILIMTCLLFILNYLPPREGNTDFARFKSEIAKLNRSSTFNNDMNDSTGTPRSNEKAEGEQVSKVNVNTCTLKDLAHVPGFTYYLALAIVNYRDIHGTYKKTDDLLKSRAMDDSTFNKIKKYIVTN